MRVRNPCLRAAEKLDHLARALAALDASCEVTVNPGCGSVLVHYDRTRISRPDMEAGATRLIGEILASAPPPLVMDAGADASAPRRERRRGHYSPATMKLNRYAKYGMAAGLGLSVWLAYAGGGGRRYHALAGWAFVACLGVHLAVHRHRLWS
jgi:hypothetical protein